MPIEETIINEVETPPITVTTSEFDGLTKSARRRLKKKLVSQSTLNASNSPDTDDNEVIDELSSVEATANIKTEAEVSNPVQQNVTVGIDVPPNDLQIIIDKMASYVTKNGKQFEETARKRQDPRLKFLEPDDCFNAYYTQKLKLYATIKRLEQTAPLKLNMDSKTNSKLPVCFSLKKQKESESVEIKKSALEDSSNETSDDEHKKDRIDKTELNHIKLNKSSTSVKKNPLQNTAKLAEERLKDKLAMAAKEKLSMLERERTKKEKEKIQAERKRKAAQFLASMKIISSSSSKNSNTINTINPSEKSDTQILDSPVHNSVVNTVDQKISTDEKNGLPDDDVKDSNIQPPSSKVQDIISIGSSDEDISNDDHLNKNINGNKSSKLSLQSRLQETLSKDNKRKKIERYEREKDNYKRIKHYDESKEKSPDHRYSSRDRDRSSRRSKKSHSSHHSSSKDHKRERGSKRSKHKHKSKKSKKHTRNHNSDSSDDSSNTNNSHFS
uniref:Protein suppressor of white apricot n=1 Tax=Schizaphis graminum TaxID=13262 RepID=A0A2S2PTC9_SCHGA